MLLPAEESIPNYKEIPNDFSLILFGMPKVGKTTFGASWPNSLLLECEPGGAKYVRCRKLDIGNLAELRQAWNLLKENPGYCETVVIDSLDMVAKWIEDEICGEMGLGNIMDTKKGERHGSQWAEYSSRILTFLAGWTSLKKRVIFLAHTKKAELSGDGLVINPKTINLYGQAASRVLAIVENVGHLYAKENAEGKVIRVLSFIPGTHVEAGARHPALNNKMIELPQENPYSAFAELFVEKASNGAKSKEKAQKALKEAVA